MSILTVDKVNSIFVDCLFSGEEAERIVNDHGADPDQWPEGTATLVDGVLNKIGLCTKRVESHRSEIAELLMELPDAFHAGKGDGMSFLNACQDKHGNQWTGLHKVMDQLFVLGMAAGLVTCLAPRAMWQALPGGMPYYVVKEAA